MQLSWVLAAGLLLIWVGERIVDSSEVRWALTGLGTLLVLGTTVLRFVKSGAARPDVKRVQRTFGLLHGLSFFSLVLYALQSDLFTKLTGATLASGSPKLAGVLAALWPALMLTSLLPTLFMELSFASMAKAPTVEHGLIQEAMLSGFGLAGAFIFAISVQYVATERDKKADLSYFRVAKASETTRKLAGSLDEAIEVYLFFPPGSDAAEAVEGYFDELKEATPLISVTRLDHALAPAKAKDLGVSGNGTVLFKKGARKETLFIGTELEKARSQLRGLDVEVNKKLVQVGKPKRTVYFTGGHGERSRDPENNNDQRATVDVLYKVLGDQKIDVQQLTTAEGLGTEIPKDAAAVFIIGPQRAFSAPEASTIEAYVKRGGRLFIALDPESGLDFAELLTPLGLSFKPQTLAQERGNANVRPPPSIADRVNIATRTFSSHPIATYLGRGSSPVLFLAAGPLDELEKHPADLFIDFAVRSLPDAWIDANNNYEFDAGETRKAYGVIAAVERKQAKDDAQPMRAVVMGDSDAISDLVLQQLPGNQYVVVDGFKWLLGDEATAGPTNTEVDVPLTRTRQQDSVWFYGTTFLAPLAVIALGFFARRRPRKRLVTTQEKAS
ncbi:MAG: Gldg family protein [Archangium sp.]